MSGVMLKTFFKEASKAISDNASRKMLEAVNKVRNQTLETLSGQRSGRTYYVPGTKRTYTASSPGQPPAIATSDLFKSIKTSIEGKGDEIIGKVGTDLEYGKYLEFGTKKMAARPWLKISFDKAGVKAILGGKWF